MDCMLETAVAQATTLCYCSGVQQQQQPHTIMRRRSPHRTAYEQHTHTIHSADHRTSWRNETATVHALVACECSCIICRVCVCVVRVPCVHVVCTFSAIYTLWPAGPEQQSTSVSVPQGTTIHLRSMVFHMFVLTPATTLFIDFMACGAVRRQCGRVYGKCARCTTFPIIPPVCTGNLVKS